MQKGKKKKIKVTEWAQKLMEMMEKRESKIIS